VNDWRTSGEHQIEQGDATRARNGRIFYWRSLLSTPREREVARVGAGMAENKGLPLRAARMERLSAASSPAPCSYRAASSPWS